MGCGIETIGGNPPGSGASSVASSVLYVVTADVDVTAVAPVRGVAVSYAMPAGTMTRDGDTLRARFGGWASSVGPAVFYIPAFSFGGTAWWAAQSTVIPADGLTYPWFYDVLITRKTATTYCANATSGTTDFNSAGTFIGRGNFNGNPFAGPMVGPEPDPVINWAVPNTFLFDNAWAATGGTWRLKSGYIDLARAP